MVFKLNNLKNKVFGRLKVLKRVEDCVDPKSKNKSARWLCKCSCGNSVIVRSGNLTRINGTKSCGCLRNEAVRKSCFKNLKGKRFGYLTVKQLDESRKQPNGTKKTMWLCKCDCGNISRVQTNSLISGHTQSCGCKSESHITKNVKKYFKNKYKAKLEYRIFRNPKTNYYLPFDIYLSEINLFIEIHGIQHYRISGWHISLANKKGTTPKEELEEIKKRDKIKKKFAKKYGHYLSVDLRDVRNIEQCVYLIEDFMTKIK